jgi:hypothetical protein
MQKTSGASRLNAQLKTARNEFVSCVTTMKLAKGENVGNIGMTFGGGCFAGHGVNISGGTARFSLTSYRHI